MAGGVAYVRMCSQNTHTQHLEAVEVKWHSCRPSRTSTFLSATHKDQYPHPQTHTQKSTCTLRKSHSCSYSCICVCVMCVFCALLYKNPLAYGSWFILLSLETSNSSSYTQSRWVSALSFIVRCTLHSALYCAHIHCILYTFQWRQPATKPVIVEVTSAHTNLQQAKASQEAFCMYVTFKRAVNT